MKKFRFFALILALVLSMCIFVGCGSSSDGTTEGDNADIEDVLDEEQTLYVYEAEDTDLSGLSGVAFSGNFYAYNMVKGLNSPSINTNTTVMNSLSGGYFVSYLNAANLTLTFVVEADEASTDNYFAIRMGSEFGPLKINPDNIEIKVNDLALDYDEFQVKGTSGAYTTAFSDAQLPNIDLNKGENIITVKILSTVNYGISNMDTEAYGPGIDCIKIGSTADLTWEKSLADHMDELSTND